MVVFRRKKKKKDPTALKHCAALANESSHPTYKIVMLRLHVKGIYFPFMVITQTDVLGFNSNKR